jgi:hypothetical protein
MADDVFVDGQPLSTSYLNDMYRRLLIVESAEVRRNATVDNTTGAVTYETRIYGVKTGVIKASKTPKPITVSFENAKFPNNSTVIYTVTPQWTDDTPSAVYYKIDESGTKSVKVTYWTGKDEISVSFNIIAVALIPKTK